MLFIWCKLSPQRRLCKVAGRYCSPLHFLVSIRDSTCASSFGANLIYHPAKKKKWAGLGFMLLEIKLAPAMVMPLFKKDLMVL